MLVSFSPSSRLSFRVSVGEKNSRKKLHLTHSVCGSHVFFFLLPLSPFKNFFFTKGWGGRMRLWGIAGEERGGWRGSNINKNPGKSFLLLKLPPSLTTTAARAAATAAAAVASSPLPSVPTQNSLSSSSKNFDGREWVGGLNAQTRSRTGSSRIRRVTWQLEQIAHYFAHHISCDNHISEGYNYRQVSPSPQVCFLQRMFQRL